MMICKFKVGDIVLIIGDKERIKCVVVEIDSDNWHLIECIDNPQTGYWRDADELEFCKEELRKRKIEQILKS